MTAPAWSPALSVGHPEIDKEHQQLFALVDRIDRADLSESLLSEAIGQLEHYTKTHFAREEALMMRAGYPHLEAHMAKHALFVEWLSAIKHAYQRSAESPFEIGETVNRFLGEWLVDHVQTEDMRYRDYIAAGRPGDPDGGTAG